MFVDRVTIRAQAGKGGDGCLSFRREKFVPRGGPDGGNGGHGGSVIFEAKDGVDSLAALAHRHEWRAKSGTSGSGSNCHGAAGPDLVIQVPPGTVVIDTAGGFVLKDLVAAGDRVTAAQGGRGGKGNTHFKTATNRAPRQWTKGEAGEDRELTLELKVIADVGLIGKPNAGKSTLLGRLSQARPQVADYAFTTKYPNLGIVHLDSDRSFVLADLPGLIEGAHAGVGLGHEFLRHIERSGILVHLIEPAPMDGTDPVANYRTIRDELARYDVALVERPEVVVVTKGELPGAEEAVARLTAEIGKDVLLISAVTGLGLKLLMGKLSAALAERDRQRSER